MLMAIAIKLSNILRHFHFWQTRHLENMADEEDTNWFVSIFFQFSQIFSMVAQILRLQLKTYKLLIINSVEEHTSTQEIGH